MVTIIGLVFAVSWAGQAGPPALREQAAPEFLTGPKYHLELGQATSGNWTNVELRSLVNKIAAERRVAILLDRRVDPTIRLPVDIVNLPLKEGLRGIARKVGGEISIPENVVYFGPPVAVGRLRTLIELRTAELTSKADPIPERRRAELGKRQTVTWEDLDTPGEVLQRVADRFHLTVRHPDLVPHDLWGACSLPSATAAEALSLILIQFDLTFTWLGGGQGIELIPIPEQVVVERRLRPKGRSAHETLKLIAEQFPMRDAKLEGTEVSVKATVEEHEAMTALLNPQATKKPTEKGPAPLSQRSFTLKFQRVPVRAVMKKLEESSVVFIYDAAEFDTAGIDLDQTIDLQLEKASATDFCKAVFSPLKLAFVIDNLTIKLTPKK